MARGPLPSPDARRRNAPTIPTTDLPAAGREGPAPDCPYELGDAGLAWWEWAWATPQAAAWDPGSLYVVARRAQLEDDVAAIEFVEASDLLADLLDGSDEAVKRVEWMLGVLKRSATGKSTLMKEMRELDERLGLTPKALAALRWKIVGTRDESPESPAPSSSKVRRLRAVDAA